MSLTKLESVLEKVQKPARYIGGELNSAVKDKTAIDVRFALCFPDLYEIGMSHLGSKILYSLMNARADVWCERVYAPDTDMEALMREKNIPLYGLESLDAISDFDIIGFSLQYEMCYPTVLNMLDLAGLPVKAIERESLSPLVIAGGPCVCNPEPMSDFIDLFVLGEGEEVTLELIDLYKSAKAEGLQKQEFLRKAAKLGGVYVPSLYEVVYNEDGTVSEIVPLAEARGCKGKLISGMRIDPCAEQGAKCAQLQAAAPAIIGKRIVEDLDSVFFPEKFVVPYIDIVHDRAILEVLRGCIRGCRFCQAGFIYRPFREKTPDTLSRNARSLCESSGYDEISLTSLSTSDYTKLDKLVPNLLAWSEEERISLSLPSLRVDNFSPELLEQIARVRKSGLTFAPEAGTQRLRDVINKNVSEDDIMRACKTAFEGGFTSVKLYFMMGLPTETDEDIAGIAELSQRIVDMFYRMPNRPKGKGVHVTISVACFVPKPFTPFEFEPQDTLERFMQKQKYLKSLITSNKISYRYHDSPTSMLEAVLARGDRKLGAVVEAVWRAGAVLDGWDEHFSLSRWQNAFTEHEIKPEFYANRKRAYDEIMPWNHLDYGVSREFLVRENKRAYEAATTPDCGTSCRNCGAAGLYKEKGREDIWPCK